MGLAVSNGRGSRPRDGRGETILRSGRARRLRVSVSPCHPWYLRVSLRVSRFRFSNKTVSALVNSEIGKLSAEVMLPFMTIPTEPIGSIPRPPELIDAVENIGDSEDPRLASLYEAAIKDTIERFEETGSPVITDGEQRKYHNFWTYSVHGLSNTAPDGFKIPFSAGHVRRMPRLTKGPFRYRRKADSYLDVAKRYAHRPVKQAVI